MIWSKTFKKVEEALGFELYGWQKDFISMEIDFIPVGGRANGKTLAFILRYLLNYETNLYLFNNRNLWLGAYYDNLFPVDERWENHRYTHCVYPQYVMEINSKLRANGIETYLVYIGV